MIEFDLGVPNEQALMFGVFEFYWMPVLEAFGGDYCSRLLKTKIETKPGTMLQMSLLR